MTSVYRIPGPEPEYDLNMLSKHAYNIFKFENTFKMRQDNGVLPEFELAYETWGTLNEAKDNAVLVFTGLSANSHAKSNKVRLLHV